MADNSTSFLDLAAATAAAHRASGEADLVKLLTENVTQVTGATFSAVFLTVGEVPERSPMRLGGQNGAETAVMAEMLVRYTEGKGLLRDALRTEDGVVTIAATAVSTRLTEGTLAALPIHRRDGHVIGVLVAYFHAHLDEGTASYLKAIAVLLGLGVENTRLALAQQRERRVAAESAVTLGTVLESVNSGICVIDLDGTIRLTNRVLADLFGVSGRLSGLAQEDVFRAASAQPKEIESFIHRLTELRSDPAALDESEWELAGDPPRTIQRHSAPMRNLLGEVVGRVEVYTDVTESRRLYTQLLHTERLRAIGEMASGIAHDFNNLLASIVGQAELLSPDSKPSATRTAIDTIRQAALDGARIVRNMQAYSRRREEPLSTAADLNDAARAAAEMARPRWSGASLQGRGPVELTLQLQGGEQGPTVAIDPTELREVLLNLLFNAADAMNAGGHISVKTSSTRRGWSEVVVSDTGHGIPEHVRSRIFEPFFSTKGAGGSGLGLAVAYSIITRHGGELEVESTVGQGTTFTIRLPNALSRPLAPGEIGPDTQGHRLERGDRIRLNGHRILLVDDEVSVLAVVRQLLERSGASVHVCEGGRSAVRAIEGGEAKFDLVVTDLDMPDADGWEVASAAKNRPNPVPVIMLTGWAGEIAPEEFRERGVDVVLAKPCRRSELDSAIAGLLGPRPEAPPPTVGMQVLVVEDDQNFAASLRDILALQGHGVNVVGGGGEALRFCQGQRPDVILTDFTLPDMTGAAFAEQLSTSSSNPPYLVLVTGHATEIDDARYLTEGIHAVLPKPCRMSDIKAVLARAAAQLPPRATLIAG